MACKAQHGELCLHTPWLTSPSPIFPFILWTLDSDFFLTHPTGPSPGNTQVLLPIVSSRCSPGLHFPIVLIPCLLLSLQPVPWLSDQFPCPPSSTGHFRHVSVLISPSFILCRIHHLWPFLQVRNPIYLSHHHILMPKQYLDEWMSEWADKCIGAVRKKFESEHEKGINEYRHK